MPLARVQSLSRLLMFASESVELTKLSKSASQGSGTVKTASGYLPCFLGHSSFLGAVSASRRPRRLRFSASGALRRTLWTPVGVVLRTARTRRSARCRSRCAEAQRTRLRADVGARYSSYSFRESLQRSEERLPEHQGRGPSCLELIGLRSVGLSGSEEPFGRSDHLPPSPPERGDEPSAPRPAPKNRTGHF